MLRQLIIALNIHDFNFSQNNLLWFPLLSCLQQTVRLLFTSGGEGGFFSPDITIRDWLELEFCPPAAESIMVGTEFLLVILEPLVEEEGDDDVKDWGRLSLAGLQESSPGAEDMVCNCLKSLWISPSQWVITCKLSCRLWGLVYTLLQIK